MDINDPLDPELIYDMMNGETIYAKQAYLRVIRTLLLKTKYLEDRVEGLERKLDQLLVDQAW